MTRYIPKSIPVEAMQWPFDFEINKLRVFEEWLCARLDTVSCSKGHAIVRFACNHSVKAGDYCVYHNGGWDVFSEEEFLSRYTPAQEGE